MLSNHWKLSESAERETLASADEDYKDEDGMLASEEEGGKDVSGGENVAHSRRWGWGRDAEESNCNVFGGAIVNEKFNKKNEILYGREQKGQLFGVWKNMQKISMTRRDYMYMYCEIHESAILPSDNL